MKATCSSSCQAAPPKRSRKGIAKMAAQAAETLGHLADWSGVGLAQLRSLNKLHKNAAVAVGRRVKLDFSQVSAQQFVAARRAYHQHLQEEFFAAHRIAGT